MTSLLATLVLAACPSSDPALDAIVWHPHFPRKVEVTLGADKVSVSHLTVTFDRAGFDKAKPGYSWHLANARLSTSRKLTIGGVKLDAGEYSIRARKTKDGSWELLADKPQRFARRATDDARALKTGFVKDAARMEHMSIDIHPSGDKSNTSLWLVVHMDTFVARSLVEIGE